MFKKRETSKYIYHHCHYFITALNSHVNMPWWTCFNCANIRSTNNTINDVRILDFSHHTLHDVPADVFQYERMLEELYLYSNRVCLQYLFSHFTQYIHNFVGLKKNWKFGSG